ncbi:MAG TPA: YfiR family protein [Azospira sp.]|nr:YfiR family protein [Azospira sp.]
MRSPSRLLAAVRALLVLATPQAFAQAPEHDLKAAFIYNFIQFTQWPDAAMKGGTINLCSSPGTMLNMALQGIAGKTAHGRAIAIVPLAGAAPGDCHVVVVTEDDRGRAAMVRKIAGTGAVLSITDDPEILREGLLIGMALDGKRIVFTIDNSRAVTAGLVLSSRLLRLARSVQ